MKVRFIWFKTFEMQNGSVNYTGDWDYIRHSRSIKEILERVFEQVGITLPTIPRDSKEEDVKMYVLSLLIEPAKMSRKCQELLDDDLDLEGMEQNIAWLRELSNQGYYIAYEE